MAYKSEALVSEGASSDPILRVFLYLIHYFNSHSTFDTAHNTLVYRHIQQPNVKMDRSYVAKPAVYRGVFSWSESELYDNIRTVKPEYSTEDPRTWPRMRSMKKTLRRFEYIIPTHVAYRQSLLIDLLKLPGMRLLSRGSLDLHSSKTNTYINRRFRFYPFNFTRTGLKRPRVGLPQEDFEYWMDLVNGPEWNTNAKTTSTETGKAIESSQNPLVSHSLQDTTPTVKAKKLIVVLKGDSLVQPIKPANQSTKMRKPLTGSQYDLTSDTPNEAEVTTYSTSTPTLQDKLAQSEHQRQQEQARADEAEQYITSLEKVQDKEALRHILAIQDLQAQLSRAEQTLRGRTAELTAGVKREKELQTELENTKRDAADEVDSKAKAKAAEQIEDIWGELQKLVRHKRGAEGEGEGGGEKRAKLL
jgi:hypothetical protein